MEIVITAFPGFNAINLSPEIFTVFESEDLYVIFPSVVTDSAIFCFLLLIVIVFEDASTTASARAISKTLSTLPVYMPLPLI